MKPLWDCTPTSRPIVLTRASPAFMSTRTLPDLVSRTAGESRAAVLRGLNVQLSLIRSREAWDRISPQASLMRCSPTRRIGTTAAGSATDYRHIEYATMVWELPVGRSKKYLSANESRP